MKTCLVTDAKMDVLSSLNSDVTSYISTLPRDVLNMIYCMCKPLDLQIWNVDEEEGHKSERLIWTGVDLCENVITLFQRLLRRDLGYTEVHLADLLSTAREIRVGPKGLNWIACLTRRFVTLDLSVERRISIVIVASRFMSIIQPECVEHYCKPYPVVLRNHWDHFRCPVRTFVGGLTFFFTYSTLSLELPLVFTLKAPLHLPDGIPCSRRRSETMPSFIAMMVNVSLTFAMLIVGRELDQKS